MGLHTCSSDYPSICFCLKLAAICATPSNTCLCGYFNAAVIIESEILGVIFIHPALQGLCPNKGPGNLCADCHMLRLWFLCV